ncbi:unnamed protein product, partial [Brachionus calyciflorus]
MNSKKIESNILPVKDFFTRCYLRDLNVFAPEKLFSTKSEERPYFLISLGKEKEKNEILTDTCKDLETCNRNITTLLRNNFNYYKLWSDELKAKEIPQKDYINFETDFSEKDCSNSFKCYSFKILIKRQQFFQPKLDSLEISLEAQIDLNSIDSFDKAFEFIQKYGTYYPFFNYQKISITIYSIECSTNDDNTDIEKFLNNYFEKNFEDIQMFDLEQEKIFFEKFENSKSFKLRIQKKILDEYFNFIDEPGPLPSNLRWISIIEILNSYFNEKNLNLNKLSKIQSAFTFYRIKECFESDFFKKHQRILDLYYFFQETISRTVRNDYESQLRYLSVSGEEVTLNEQIKTIEEYLKSQVELFKPLIDRIMNKKLLYLNQSNNLITFLNEFKNSRIVIFYFNRYLASIKPECFYKILESIDTYLKENTTHLAILVDYDNHKYLSDKKVFYKKTLFVEYTFRLNENVNDLENFLNRNRINFTFQNRIALNDLDTYSLAETLDLSMNRLVHLNKFMFMGPFFEINLKELILENNMIEFIDSDAFSGLLNLNILNLSCNFIKVIDYRLFSNLKLLTHLNLSSNRIERIQSFTFAKLDKLEYLNLSNNYLRVFNNKREEGGIFKSLKNLKVLDLSYNKIQEFRYAEIFSVLKNLKELYLSSNEIYLPSLMTNLNNHSNDLEILDLSRNNFLNLESIEFGRIFPKLKALCLNDNFIDRIKYENFKNLNNLQVLLLHSNVEINLSDDIFSNGNLQSLKVVSLYRNADKDDQFNLIAED